jgi:sterol desaturase/sphingolipid hydroxylase (fatty acid hydroxylase superfamily)
MLIVSLLVLAAVFGLLERIAGSVPRKGLFRRERVPDFLWWFFTPLVSRSASTIAVFITVAAITIISGRTHTEDTWFTRTPILFQIVVLLVVSDFLGYFAHRLFHSARFWRFHAIHHSAEDLDWLAAARVHPVNEIGNRLLQVIPLYLLGIRGAALASIVPIFTLYALFVHANIRWDFGPLRYLIASPVYHRWHHTKAAEGRDKNFAGLFPWIDALFGTLYLPRGVQPHDFGVDEEVPRGIAGQLVWPFTSGSPAPASGRRRRS